MQLVIIETLIALAFMFFLLSIIASGVNELIAGVCKLRARMLEQGVASLVTGKRKPGASEADNTFVKKLFGHPLVTGYSNADAPAGDIQPPPPPPPRRPWRTRYQAPSYLASRSFRSALLDQVGLLEQTVTLATSSPPTADELDEITRARAAITARIDAIEHEQLKDTLATIWRSADHEATEFRRGVERWFDRGMDRVSGWYKRWSQIILFVVGFLVAATLNASALNVANHLYRDDTVRSVLVAEIDNRDRSPAADPSAADPTVIEDDTDESTASQTTPPLPTPGEALEEVRGLNLPIGWSEDLRPKDVPHWLAAILGWLVTAVALMLGAPFWFDVLGKASNLRSTGSKPASTLSKTGS